MEGGGTRAPVKIRRPSVEWIRPAAATLGSKSVPVVHVPSIAAASRFSFCERIHFLLLRSSSRNSWQGRRRRRSCSKSSSRKPRRAKRRMVRLTADLIWKSPHFFNAIKERELDLRGNKIAVIENLGATEDQFDTIDLSDNEIVKLENFPYLNRLGTLLINNNRITRINPNIGEFLPKLHTLVVCDSQTKIASRVLDFRKVKSKERLEAEQLFSSKEVEEEAKKESTKTFSPGEVQKVLEPIEEPQAPKVVAPTPEQIIAIKAAIVNSQTLEEVARLEKALKSGQLPADLKIPEVVSGAGSVKERDEEMSSANQDEAYVEQKNVEEQTNDEPAPMEQE
ncbi:hypothetical protein NL676_005615 [Syzygium grande]|nr:hypothetical protein NL676_005615 [Syzygium grande]